LILSDWLSTDRLSVYDSAINSMAVAYGTTLMGGGQNYPARQRKLKAL